MLLNLYRSFRLRKQRALKNLLIINKGGCGRLSPGIGDISSVKDLQTEEIVSTKFRCSNFGTYYPRSSRHGWVGFSSFPLNKLIRRFLVLPNFQVPVQNFSYLRRPELSNE